MTSFDSFALPSEITQALQKLNFTTPTPVQSATIPLGLEGRDILASAQTGTGKTAAFVLPILAHMLAKPDTQALIMLPTRELAAQVQKAVSDMSYKMGIKSALLIGGDPMPKQIKQLQARPRFIIGTPGRLNDHLKRRTLHLKNATMLVLDETDRMLDMGFGIQIESIIAAMPKERQTFMFSATMPKGIQQLAQKYLNNPERVAIGEQNHTANTVEQIVVKLDDSKKYDTLRNELYDRKGSVIVFVKTKFGADRLAKRLCKDDLKSESLHGDLPQRRRERVIREFRSKNHRILVATDIAARGLDIPHIEHVINYDLPQSPEDFIHRIGRTGRAGAKGQALSFISPNEGRKWHAIECLLDPDKKKSRSEGGKGNNNDGKPRKRKYGQKNGKSFAGKKARFSDGDKPAFASKKKSFGGKKKGGFGNKNKASFGAKKRKAA